MEIGSKLKNARMEAGFTQETIAEKIGVSRQTISNWENNRSYPDIISVISLSDFYSVSLDELLKEDKKMIEYLEKSTDVVQSRQNFSKLILLVSYIIIWSLSIISFWLRKDSDAMGYALVTLYFILPVTTIIISVFIGKDDGWTDSKWIMLLFFGCMYMLAPYATFSMASMISTGNIHIPEVTAMLPGILTSGFGMLIGSLIRRKKLRKH